MITNVSMTAIRRKPQITITYAASSKTAGLIKKTATKKGVNTSTRGAQVYALLSFLKLLTEAKKLAGSSGFN